MDLFHRKAKRVSNALRIFRLRRDSMVHRAMVYNDYLAYTFSFVASSDEAFKCLFPKDTSDKTRFAVMEDAFIVGTTLRSVQERMNGDVTDDLVRNRQTVKAVLDSFTGIDAVKAFTLTLGYETADVVALSPETVSAVFDMVLSTRVQRPLAVYVRCVTEDIDLGLMDSLTSHPDDFLSMSRS